MRVIASMEELRALIGGEVAVSDWIEISQERVGLFADATGDHQWIHVDVERSRRESPYGGTIVHGFLTLSLLPLLMKNAISMPDCGMEVNYGLNKLRFPAAAPVGSRLRGRLTLLEMEDIDGGVQITWKTVIEREGGDKPVCVAEPVLRRYR